MSEIERVILAGKTKPISHFCHVVKAGDLVWVSGAVGRRGDGSIPESTVDQMAVALKNMDDCLKAVGAGPEHVVKVTVILTDINDRAAINPLREDYFGEHLPASTLYEVSALVQPELKVEIEAQAYLGS